MSYDLQALPHSTFQVTFLFSERALVQSLVQTRLLTGATRDDTFRTVRFKAVSATLLPEFIKKYGPLSVTQVAKMVLDLGTQLKYLLETTHCGLFGYSPDHVLVLNDGESFVFLGNELVAPVVDGHQLHVYAPLSRRDCLFSPELERITQLPAQIHFKSAYYSLACLLIFALLGKPESLEALHGHPLEGSKLYGLLSHCLSQKAEERSLVWV